MKLDIERIKNQVDMSEEAFARKMEIPLDELHLYCDGKCVPKELENKMCAYTGLQPIPGEIYKGENPISSNAQLITPEDTYEPLQQAKHNLVEYVRQGLSEFQEETIRSEIEKIRACVNMLRKPRISFAGQSDTGKSTLINALLGAERMPAKWTPTTSIAVHIKHIDDRPDFITDDVWIFREKDGESWDDTRLNDETYCKSFLIARGDFSLLSDFGTHQGEKENQQRASSAVAFIESPLLKNCDILDLPGFAATAEDNAIHRFNTQENGTDILLYLSRSNGFLQDGDLTYLHECIKSLRPIEQKERNNLGKLCNLFVIASQAGTVKHGNSTELSEIMNGRCKALCDGYATVASEGGSKSLLPFRSNQTGYNYEQSDFRARFFTYEKDIPRLCEAFNETLTKLSEDLPRSLYQDFCRSLKEIAGKSSKIIQERIENWNNLLSDKEKYVKLVREINENEPVRRREQKNQEERMMKYIDALSAEARQDVRSKYDEIMNVGYIVDRINRCNVKNKKSDKEDFVATLNELLSNQVQTILSAKTNKYVAELDDYLKEYSKSFAEYATGKNIEVSFDSTNAFALGLTGLGALGASAAWLTTSFTALSVATLGTFAGWGSILAVGGVIGIAIGAVIAAFIALFSAVTWKEKLAKSIIDAYQEKNYLNAILNDIKKFWVDTKSSFIAGSNRVEKDWQAHISDYELIADEKNIPALERKIAEAKRGMDFFTKIPLPEVGSCSTGTFRSLLKV